MFSKLFSLIFSSNASSLAIMGETVKLLDSLVKHMEANYSKDKDTYDASIDTICQILQEHKSKKLK